MKTGLLTFLFLLSFVSFPATAETKRNKDRTPSMIDPTSTPAQKTEHGARLVGAYALLKKQGLRKITEAGVVESLGKGRWTIDYKKLGQRVSLRALSPEDPEYKRLDKNKDGRIDYLDHKQSAFTTYRTIKPIENEELAEAAALLRRIDQRIASLADHYEELSFWGTPLKTKEKTFFNETYINPVPTASGKLLQFKYTTDANRYHRLVYQNRDKQHPFNLSIRVIHSELSRRLSALNAPHFDYSRSCVIFEQFDAKGELRQELIRIVQEERFAEPGPIGIEYRAIVGASGLTDLARNGKFPDLRWQHQPGENYWYSILLDSDQLILLCQPVITKPGWNPFLPLVIRTSDLPNAIER